ncbi:hypothetical protein EB796_024858 [Bugula neritina]|uniref:IgGFc-binding protein N-terminal domain-containing protein n=1 Tax=Bugula neritina TaxID=10212 RepID=A0A7J7ISB3_BUGNE|nr:hypothetical protein EB796_024858 [Bugula neritina]
MPLVRSPALHLREFLVTKGNVTEVNFPQSMMHTGSGKSNRGIHVISTAPIGIYGINTQRFSSEGFIAIPNHLLGTEYYAVGMAAEDQHSQVGIIAAERGITTVIITLPDDVDLQIDFEGRSYSANSVIVTSLKHFETLQLQHRNFKRGTPRGDISGARIQCTKRCSVFSGNSRTSVFGSSRDLLVEQLPPVSSWGTQFAVPSTPKRIDREDIIKIVCHQDGTHVLIDAVALQCNSGGSLQKKLNTTSFPHYIISTKPILVASIVLSQKAELAETLTDPAMTLIIPERQYAQVYTISTPRSSSAYLNGADYTNYLTLVIRKNNVHLLMMDGAYLDAAYSNIIWMDVPYTNTGGRVALSTAHIGIPPGTHTITTSESDATFMCIVSGSADRESYAYWPV